MRYAILLIALVGCQQSFKPIGTLDLVETPAESSFQETAPQEDGYFLGVTMPGYLRLKPEMNHSDVVVILDGTYGTELSRHGPLSTFKWTDGDKFILVTFEKGLLVGKLQGGLD